MEPLSRKAINLFSGIYVPVGLLGLQSQMTFVCSSIAANIASKSCSPFTKGLP